MKGAVVNKTKSTFSSSPLTDDNIFVFDPEVGGVASVFTRTENGLVPAPNGSGAIKYLREDGTWVIPPDTNTAYTHPSKTWVDKTTLINAEIISNISVNSLGHPTGWSTRALTPANIGAEPSFSKNTDFNKTLVGGNNITISRSGSNVTIHAAGQKFPFVGGQLTVGKAYLDSHEGRMYGFTTTNPFNFTSYVVDTSLAKVEGGFMRILIKTSSEPTVFKEDGTTPAVKIFGATFQVDTEMELIIESPDGVRIEYYFLRRN